MVTSFPIIFPARFFAYDRNDLFRKISQEGKNTPSNPIVTETSGQNVVLFSPSFCLGGSKSCIPMTIIRPTIMATLGNTGAMKPYFLENWVKTVSCLSCSPMSFDWLIFHVFRTKLLFYFAITPVSRVKRHYISNVRPACSIIFKKYSTLLA